MVKQVISADEKAELQDILARLKEKTGLTWEDIGELLGMDVKVVHRLRYGTRRGTLDELKAIRILAKQRKVDSGFGPGHIEGWVADMDIDRDMLKADVLTAEGDYLSFTQREGGNVAVTHVRLGGLEPTQAFPVFEAVRRDGALGKPDRPEIRYRGFYFIYEKALHAIGYRSGTAHPWTFMLRRTPDHDADFHGMFVSANRVDASFISTAYWAKAGGAADFAADRLGTIGLADLADPRPKAYLSSFAPHRVQRPTE